MVKTFKKEFEEICEEIENGVANYEVYMIPKGSMSNKMFDKLIEKYDGWEQYISDELAENTEGIGDEGRELKYYERWHYCFCNKNKKEYVIKTYMQ